ncbi:MAG: SDR family oxidoreductase [Flavobacteriales bacterium]|nr:SDR family oxidoreductase [Flavobacteriales bacterium]
MKTVLITGAGTGIGKASAIRLASEGYAIILVGRRREPLEAVYEGLQGEGHLILSVDVSDKAALHKALNSGVMDGRSLHGVYANAGIGGPNEYGEEDRWEQIIDINLSGAYYTVKECYPFLKASKSEYRHVLITSSCLARFGVPYYTAYCASKSGVTGLVRALAVEWANDRILVNAVLPGWVDTEMARAGIQLLADDLGQSYDQTYLEQMKMVPLQKMSDPQEIAALVAYLFSPDQRSITGQGLDINNGSFMI